MPDNRPLRIVLTGATRGLGRAMLAGFAERGHTVIGCGSSSEHVAAIAAQFPAPHSFAVVDVSSDAAVSAWARDALTSGGAPDLLINNAAVIHRPADLWNVPREEFDRLLDVNVKGTANVIRHFTPAMVARGRGVIVNFSSGWGRIGAAQQAPYCATKWAIEGLTQSMAEELPAGMAAVPLDPGIINTEMLQVGFGAAGAAAYPRPEDWAKRAVPFLLSLGPADNGRPASVPAR